MTIYRSKEHLLRLFKTHSRVSVTYRGIFYTNRNNCNRLLNDLLDNSDTYLSYEGINSLVIKI